jgi:polyphosphate kinase
MYLLKHAQHHNKSIMGGVVPLAQIRALVELTPMFGDQADHRLTKESSMEYTTQFWLDKYFDKEVFYVLTP